MWQIKNNKIKSCTIVLIVCAINLSSLGSCSPAAEEFVSSSQKRNTDDFIMDSVIPNDFSSGEARIFGNFSFGTSSILTVAGFVIVGIILFELAVYALDVYYNQQPVTNWNTSKIGTSDWVGNRYSNYASSGTNQKISPEYPPYYDYYQGTYRYFGREWRDLDKIIMWMQTAFEMYSAGTSVINDIECQMKV